jgi:hypothetical protein
MSKKPNQDQMLAAMSRDERIEALAYQLWEEDGRPEGKSEEHWFRACALIDAEMPAGEELAPEGLDPADERPSAKVIEAKTGKKAEEKPSFDELRRMKSRSAA